MTTPDAAPAALLSPGQVRLRDPLTLGDYAEACLAFEIDLLRALRDPVSALPQVASAPLETGLRFLRLALVGGFALDLDGLDEDAVRLFVSVVFVHFIERLRWQTRFK
jgi:hypothetical protein